MIKQHKVVWVVGASTGIGKALVEQLDASGRTIYISARGGEALKKLCLKAKGEIVPLVADVTDPTQLSAAAESINRTSGHLDMVIVNAGVCEYMDSPCVDLALVERVMNTNFYGALGVVNAALPLLRKAQKGSEFPLPKLVIMSSSVTYQALPRAHAYGASKAALRYVAECLKIELQKEKIDVHIVSPGFVETPLTDKNDFPMPLMIGAAKAAERIVKGLEKNTFDIAFPSRFTYLLKAVSMLPDAMRFKLLSLLSRNENPGVGDTVLSSEPSDSTSRVNKQ